MNAFKIAAVQATPVFLELEATLDKTCRLIAEAGAAGAKLVTFPEAFLPGYPLWVWFIPPGKIPELRALYAELHANAVTIPGPVTDRLGEAARAAGVTVAIGVNERNTEASDGTLFNTLLYIGSDGAILGRHRKLMPTAAEKMVWGLGDGSDLEVYDTPVGRLGGLLCWENYMPLARYAMIAWGTQVFVAPTWDRGEPWLSTMRHVAKEGRCFVVGCCSAMHIDDVPDRLAFKADYLQSMKGWINPGHSVIVDPDGKVVAGPATDEETILIAEVQPDQLTGPRWQIDVGGNYARPDVFQLRVDRTPRPIISETTREAGVSETGAGDPAVGAAGEGIDPPAS